MAKISFTKLGLVKDQNITKLTHNGQEIEVKNYLPVNEKLVLISNVINSSSDENNFANPLKVTVFLALEIVENYTNIKFTEKQKEDPTKLYDLLVSSDLLNEIQMAIPREELKSLINATWDSIEAFYKYRNSALGVMEAITQDYSDLKLDASEIQKKLSDPKNLDLLKTIMTKLG